MATTDNHRETLHVTDQITGQPMPVDGDSTTGAMKIFGTVSSTPPAGVATEAKQDTGNATVQDLYNQLAPVIGNRMEIVQSPAGIDYLYHMRNTGTEMYRAQIFF